MSRKNVLQVYCGNSNRDLARRIADYIGIPLGNATLTRFPDLEIDVKVHDDVRGADVYVIQPTCPPVNENLMELLILMDCLRRASADRITAVIPYYGYARQDRKAEGRVPITAKLVADLIVAAGANRVLTIDLHAAQIQGFFNIPVDHIYAAPVMMDHFRKLELHDLLVVAPDVGSLKMCRAYAKRLGVGLAIVDKRRTGPEETEVAHVIGETKGKTVLFVDDMISTATSITEAVKVVRERGVRDVYMCATHAVLCGRAIEKLEAVRPAGVVVTDTIPLGDKKRDFMQVLSVANLLGEAIKRIHKSESVSSLFV